LAITNLKQMKNILIARPQNQAKELAAFLEKRNCKVIIEPIFQVEFCNFAKINFDFAALIITSVNALAALEKINAKKEIKIFTLGKKLSQQLINLGFKNLTIAENSAENLFAEIAKFNEKILYLRGEKISFDFAAQFKNISEILTYKIIENQSFSPDFLEFCKKNNFDEILIFSKNSAEIFVNLAKKHNLLAKFINCKMVCLSENICNFIKNFGFENCETFLENQPLKAFYE